MPLSLVKINLHRVLGIGRSAVSDFAGNRRGNGVLGMGVGIGVGVIKQPLSGEVPAESNENDAS